MTFVKGICSQVCKYGTNESTSLSKVRKYARLMLIINAFDMNHKHLLDVIQANSYKQIVLELHSQSQNP